MFPILKLNISSNELDVSDNETKCLLQVIDDDE